MNIDDFNLVAKILKDRSGLVLGSDKAYLLESRLNPVARKYDLADLVDDMADFTAMVQGFRKRNLK